MTKPYARPRPSRFVVERLEPRENPAGDVTATMSLSTGVLSLDGDAAGNSVSVQMDQNGDYFVYGVGGTTINGQTHIHLGNATLAGVQVATGAGNDTVEFVNIHTPGAIRVQTGDGDDAAVLYNVSAGSMALSLEGGDDLFVTDNVWVNGRADLDGGAGTDTIDFRTYGIAAVTPNLTNTERQVRVDFTNNVAAGVLNGVLTLQGDSADNRFSIQQDVNGDYFVYGVNGTTINGQSYIYIGRTLTGVQVTTGAGNDSVELVKIRVSGAISVSTGEGDDVVALYQVSSSGMNLDLGTGNDLFITDDVWVNGRADLNGGNEFDTIDYRTHGIAAVTPNLTNTEREVRN
jgi:hypothetical protein